MIKVSVDPLHPLGIGQRRVAIALSNTAPEWVQIVAPDEPCDVQILHVVGRDAIQQRRTEHFAVVQYALDYEADAEGQNVPTPPDAWQTLWCDARLVWSYYDLTTRFQWARVSTPKSTRRDEDGTVGHFYLAPLGVAGDLFTKEVGTRDVGIVTSGWLSGPHAEAIEEAALAAHRCDLTSVNLGPLVVEGMQAQIPGRSNVWKVTDAELARLYHRAKWVSGLRHHEGFELGVIEGLACGARPIVFDLPCYRLWFEDHAAFVPEASGEALVQSLVDVLSRPPRPVLPDERRKVLETFHWETIGHGFWKALRASCKDLLQPGVSVAVSAAPSPAAAPAAAESEGPAPVPAPAPASVVTVGAEKRKLLWIGDSPTTPWTGFGRASYKILDVVRQHFDVTAIGTTHDGFPYDRRDLPYDVYPANVSTGYLVNKLRPSVVVIQHDPWQVPNFTKAAGNVPVIASMPIDGKNCRCDHLNGLALAIWWTEFADREARLGGYAGPSTIIPLGVDTTMYRPVDKRLARASMRLPEDTHDAFIVGFVGRNQPRKRMDLAVHHFAEWVRRSGVTDAYLYLQTAPTGEVAYDVSDMMRYERLSNRLILLEQGMREVIPEASMRNIYSALDVFWSTTQGEGWGLPALEAMACGVPCVLPDWAAYGDWAAPAAHLVKVGDIAATINSHLPVSGRRVGVYGAVPDLDSDIAALDRMYRDREYRAERAAAGLALARSPKFSWRAIGEAFVTAITETLDGPVDVRLEDMGA